MSNSLSQDTTPEDLPMPGLELVLSGSGLPEVGATNIGFIVAAARERLERQVAVIGTTATGLRGIPVFRINGMKQRWNGWRIAAREIPGDESNFPDNVGLYLIRRPLDEEPLFAIASSHNGDNGVLPLTLDDLVALNQYRLGELQASLDNLGRDKPV